MSADSRTVTTDALETLGQIHLDPQHRDAIHLAVEPVIAGEDLMPGDHIRLYEGKAYKDLYSEESKLLGIVDPFISGPIEEGESFWLVVYPRQIRSLRHVWEHPDFPPST